MERSENQPGKPTARPGEQKDRSGKDPQRTPGQTTNEAGNERQRDFDAE